MGKNAVHPRSFLLALPFLEPCCCRQAQDFFTFAPMHLTDDIFACSSQTFDNVALEVYRYQFEKVAVYRAFCEAMKRTPEKVQKIEDIPFLPIEFFKTHKIIVEGKTEELVFESSTTTGAIPGKHYVADKAIYEKSFLHTFEQFYGEPEQYLILALLPNYLERGNSSLVYMVNELIKRSKHSDSAFFLHNTEQLKNVLQQALQQTNIKILLIGVTYALLDFAEKNPMNLHDTIVMETGGMKGRKTELTRPEIHRFLQQQFSVSRIHSEYGMTELLSQAYTTEHGTFASPNFMRVLARDPYEPSAILPAGKNGVLNVIDLANIYSCSFIATGDIGKVFANGEFEVMGRMDAAEIRGCNLMYSSFI